MTDPKGPLFGAIEAGGTKFVLAIFKGEDEVLVQHTLPTTSPAETFAHVIQFFEKSQQEFGAVSAFGVASFGPINIDKRSPSFGVIGSTPKPGWAGASMIAPLRQFGVPIALDTDVNCAGLGEWTSGAGQGCETLAYITVGTGVGIGVLDNGTPINGCGHLEGGHIRVPRHPQDLDFAGSCPFHGDCLEGLASGTAISRRWGRPLGHLGDRNDLAIEVEAHYLAEACMTLTYLHRPDRIILGGGVMQAAGLLAQVRQLMEQKAGRYLDFPGGLEQYVRECSLSEIAPALAGANVLAKTVSRAA